MKAKPVSTAPDGRSAVVENPTCEKEPVVGRMYMERVELKETVEEFGWIVQATVVSLSSTVKEISVWTVAFNEVEFPPPK